ncbi:MAG: MerR family transcriptional regulator [Alphaproteobacteria bacterium]|nr:MerR family transcriptional regulator [Alphaproteobacteria bacterium]
MKIGKLAVKAAVSIDTIRFYERRGLLPEPERLASGYRVYSGAIVNRIIMIKSLKALGFNLDEIIQNLNDLDAGELNCESGEVRMEIVLARVADKISELSAVKNDIEAALVQCRAGTCRFNDRINMCG